MPSPTKYRILSFDGGGIRALLSLVLLERLEQQLPGWMDKADLLAGTSTGGIVALGLAHGVPLATLRELYEKKGKKIFDDGWLDNLKDLGSLIGSQYDNKGLAKELRNLFGDTPLKRLKKRVLIPTFDLDNEKEDETDRCWAPKFFHNFPGDDTDGDLPAWKVALYTTAAPTYFPSVEGYIDGGVVANNPSMAALAQTQDRRAIKSPPKPNRVALFSVGTGKPLMKIKKKTLDWGQSQWVKPIVNIMMDGVMGVADYQCRHMLRDKYFRLAPRFPPDKAIGLDAVDKIPDLIAFAKQIDIRPAIQWLRKRW